MRRWLMVLAVLLIPASFIGAGIASPAFAANAGVSCGKLTGSTTSTTVTISKCNDKLNTGGSGSFPTSTVLSGSGKITWNGTGTTKVDNITFGEASSQNCATGSTEEAVSGDVAGGSGAAPKSIHKGWVLNGDVCLNGTTGAITLAPDTKLTIAPASSS